MTDISLEIDSLSKSYGALKAVDQLNLRVNRGEIFGLLGPNGAGKTTTIHIICGLIAPDSGEIRVDGRRVVPGDFEMLRRVGVCTQQNILYDKLTCLEQLVFAGEMYKLPVNLARRRAELLLEQLGLLEKKDQLANRLSGGMQRRLNFAMGLVHDPDLVVLDEPESGLDPQSRVLVREMIRSLARKKTVLFTTHNMDEADRLCDRVAIIDHGRLLVVDTPEDLKRTAGEGDVMEIDLPQNLPEALREAIASLGVQVTTADHTLILRSRALLDKLPRLWEMLQNQGVHFEQARMRSNTLEDVFITLTGRRLRE